MLENERYFDPSYKEVDRIIDTTELFPVVHPKKANDIRDKWNEPLTLIVSKLLNFDKSDVLYGIHLMEPINPERDECPNYKKIIHTPMDLSTILNRLYLDYYQSNKEF